MRFEIDKELSGVCMSEELKHKIQSQAKRGLKKRKFSIALVAALVVLLCGTTVFAGYKIYNKIQINETILPELDHMYPVEHKDILLGVDENGFVNAEINNYQEIQNILGITLLNTDMADNNEYVQGNLKTDRESSASIILKNYIIGDTYDFVYNAEEDRYKYQHGKEYYTPVSLEINIILGKEQSEEAFETDYLGMYQFVENYTSEKGYKVNIIEDTTDENVENYISQKMAIFVADGIRYTLKGLTSVENTKAIVDSMK